MRKLFLSASILLAAAALISWGVKGHRAVARIAENHLSPAAKAAVRDLIGDTSLAEISTWPDEVLRQQEYRHTAPWHYLNLPLGLTRAQFDAKVRSLGPDNVYAALQFQERILEGTGSTRSEKVEALKYVVHFVGDLHQPMHISRAEDKGGNTIQLSYDGKGTNLHALWDSRLIDHEGLTDEQMAAEYDHATPGEIREWQSEPLMEWIWESYQASSKLYAEVDAMKGRNIDDSYYQAHIGIIHVRIEKAGIRLAGLLNSIFKHGLAGSAASPAPARAAEAKPSQPIAIKLQDAAQYYNQYVTCCAKVYGTKALENLTLVNLGAAYPDQLMTVVLRSDAKDLGSSLDGKTICVTGTVVSYRGKPEIVVTDPKMITTP